MDKQFDIQTYMTKGVERVVKDILKATNKNPRESAFMLRFAKASKDASRKRKFAEDKGWHIPPFLIASITSQCNLHCEGCYSRHNHATEDTAPDSQLTGEEWFRIFQEAEKLGISFILLAGGEPMLRRDVIEAAGEMTNILFPIFTNGIFIDNKYLKLFDEKRNLVPIMSIEGNKEITDARRGTGVYDKLICNMDEFHRRNLIFGASITVTTENINEVTKESFLRILYERGCKAVVFVEYVPVTEDSKGLAIGEIERDYLHTEIDRLRRESPEMVYISFPTESGTLYSKKELEDIYQVCKKHQVPLFIDGARLGYGLCANNNDLTFADIAKLCDVFYIGGTKVGALFGEAVVIVNDLYKKDFKYHIKQHGGMLAKGRMLGIQFETLFTDHKYLEISKHCIDMANLLAKGLEEKGYTLKYTPQTNQLFPIVSNEKIEELKKEFGFEFWEPYDDNHQVIRFVTSFTTPKENIEKLLEAL